MDCIFCGIVKGDIPSYKIWEDDEHMAFLSIFPNTDGFSVVIPKKHYDSVAFEDADPEVMCKLTAAAQKAAKKIQLAFEDVGRVGLICEGLGINHLHVKLFPMHGTGDMANWENRESKTMNDFFEMYPGFISSNDSHKADDEVLQSIADKINQIEE